MLKKQIILITLILIFLFSAFAFSEVTGNITLGNTNITAPPTTGVYGYTVAYCNITADCRDTSVYRCFIDYDSNSSWPWTGWCNSTSLTRCYHNFVAYTTGSTFCDTTTSYRTCTTGNWSATTACGVNQTCSGGTCSTVNASSSGGGGGGGGSSSTAITTYSSITVSTPVPDFNMTQNTSTMKVIGIKNSGNTTQYNLTIAVSGLDSSWYSFLPEKYNSTYKTKEYNFTFSFSIPYNAEVKTYTITVTASTANTSVTTADIFSLKILPSNETVEKEINPNYELYASMLETLLAEITELETKGSDVAKLKEDYDTIESKLNQTKTAIDSGDYYTANVLLNEIKTLIDTMETDIEGAEILPKAEKAEPISMIWIIVIVIIIAIIAFLLYILWPTKEEKGYRSSFGWAPEKIKKKKFGFKSSKIFTKKEQETFLIGKGEHNIAKEILDKLKSVKNIFKRKKKEKKETKETKQRGGFKYEFKK